MLTYSVGKYLKSIPLSDIPEHLRFINLFHVLLLKSRWSLVLPLVKNRKMQAKK